LKLKQVAILCGTVLQMQATTAALWFMTNWGIGRVMFGAILITAIGDAALCIGAHRAKDYIKRNRQQVRRFPEQHRRFQVFDLEGELIEVPVTGTDMVEIRNVVAKRNILPPTKAMQDVG
jgi:hypothetical protein